MDVLIISDEPERESFRQIMKLKSDIENVTNKRIYLIAFSTNGVFLNRKFIAKTHKNEIFTMLKTILKRKAFSLFIISLELKHLKRLFSHGSSLLDLINETSPKATVFS